MAKPNHIVTATEAQTALRWAKQHFGLSTWKIKLLWGGDMPAWSTESVSSLGLLTYNKAYRLASIWVSPEQCVTDGRLPIQCLMHEVVHLALETSELQHSRIEAEFMIDRIADVAEHAYRTGMRPWR